MTDVCYSPPGSPGSFRRKFRMLAGGIFAYKPSAIAYMEKKSQQNTDKMLNVVKSHMPVYMYIKMNKDRTGKIFTRGIVNVQILLEKAFDRLFFETGPNKRIQILKYIQKYLATKGFKFEKIGSPGKIK